MNSLYKRFSQNLILICARSGIQAAFMYYLIRKLGSAEFVYVGFLLSVQAINMLADFGYSKRIATSNIFGAQNFRKKFQNTVLQYVTIGMCMNVISMGILIIFVEYEHLTDIKFCVIFFICSLAKWPFSIFQASYNSQNRQNTYLILDILRLVFVILTILMLSTVNIYTYIIVECGFSIIFSIYFFTKLQNFKTADCVNNNEEKVHDLKIWSSSKTDFFIISLTGLMMSQIDKFLLPKFISQTEMGQVYFYFMIGSFIVKFCQPISNYIGPYLRQALLKTNSNKYFLRLYSKYVFIVLIMYLGVISVASAITSMTLDNNLLLMNIIIAVVAARNLGMPLYYFQVATGDVKLQRFMNIIGLGIILCNAILFSLQIYSHYIFYFGLVLINIYTSFYIAWNVKKK